MKAWDKNFLVWRSQSLGYALTRPVLRVQTREKKSIHHTSRKLSLICCSARRTPPIASSKSLRASQHLKRGSLLVEQPLWSCEVLILHLVPFNAKYGVSSLKAVVTHATFQAPQHFLGAQLPKKDCVCSSRKAAAARSLRFRVGTGTDQYACAQQGPFPAHPGKPIRKAPAAALGCRTYLLSS